MKEKEKENSRDLTIETTCSHFKRAVTVYSEVEVVQLVLTR
jgi:hypothetical protein